VNAWVFWCSTLRARAIEMAGLVPAISMSARKQEPHWHDADGRGRDAEPTAGLRKIAGFSGHHENGQRTETVIRGAAARPDFIDTLN
jgi:hypothetical protein